MGGKVAALQAHCKTLETEAERWQALWRSAAASNAQLTARVAALQDGQARARSLYLWLADLPFLPGSNGPFLPRDVQGACWLLVFSDCLTQ